MSVQQPLVSILIPVYGVESYIEECLRSVLHQRYAPLEIIIVDDCSPDNSIVLAQKLIGEENACGHSVRVIHHKENLGQAGARQTLMEAAGGELIMFLDGDDYFLSDHAVEEVVAQMQYKQGDLLIFNYIELFHRSRRLSKLPQILDARELSRAYLDGTTPAYLWNKCFRRDAFIRNANLWEIGNNMWEDMHNVVLYTFHAHNIVYMDKHLVAYRRTNERSITLDFSSRNIQSMRRVVASLSRYFAEKCTPSDFSFFKDGLDNASQVINLMVLCSADYQGMRQVLSEYPSLHDYAQRVGGVGGEILRLALCSYRNNMYGGAYALLRLKALLQKLR